jgi:hypothetical protein
MQNFGGTYSSGSVQDLHLIPFSSSPSGRMGSDTKTESKDTIYFSYPCGMMENLVSCVHLR